MNAPARDLRASLRRTDMLSALAEAKDSCDDNGLWLLLDGILKSQRISRHSDRDTINSLAERIEDDAASYADQVRAAGL